MGHKGGRQPHSQASDQIDSTDSACICSIELQTKGIVQEAPEINSNFTKSDTVTGNLGQPCSLYLPGH
jgi:hypothetical protein